MSGADAAGESPVVEVRGLSKRFGDAFALQELTLRVHEGEMFALVGPDGAGKTTLLRLLCGLLPPSGGEARIFGLDVRREMARIRPRIGYFSQGFSLYGDLTVDENIEFFAEIHGVKDYRLRREELLQFTRLAPFRRRLAEKLSGGMKQKLALACTLIHRPGLLLLDEPTTGVDPVSRRDFWLILSGLTGREMTILLTTPYLDEAERCHRVGLLRAGRLLVADTPEGVKARLPGTLVEIVCSDARRAFHLLRADPGLGETQLFGDRVDVLMETGAGGQEELRRRLEREGIEIRSLRPVRPRLENAFIALARGERSGS